MNRTFVATELIIDMSSGLVLQKKGFWHRGNVAACKGASAQQTQLANSQQNFYNQLVSDYSTQFANQSAILKSLSNSLSPTLNAGPNQFGYSAAQVNNLNSSAIQNSAQQYANASKALRENQAAAGGGNALLPSGANQAQQAALSAASANQTSNQLLGIQQAGYQQGNQNYNNAVSALGGVASQYNPTGYAGASTSAGGAASNTANEVTQLNNAASPWNLVGGILGGAASGLTSGLTGGLSNLFGGNSGVSQSANPQLPSFAPAAGDNTNWMTAAPGLF